MKLAPSAGEAADKEALRERIARFREEKASLGPAAADRKLLPWV